MENQQANSTCVSNLVPFAVVVPVDEPDDGCDSEGCLATRCNVTPFSTSINC